MTRYVGARNNTIYTVSDCLFSSEKYTVVMVPPKLETVPSNDLLQHYVVRNGKVVAKNEKIVAKELRVAFVGNWKMKCGISTYSEHLWPEIAKHIGSFKLFIERNPVPTGSIYEFGDTTLLDDDVVACWERGSSLQELVDEIKKFDPDIVHIQHEFGCFPVASHYLSMMSQLSSYRVITTVHSTFHHKDKTICEAAMKEIIVHLQGAKDLLKHEKGLAADIYVIPHGCTPCSDKTRLWDFYHSRATFVQSGFGFRYKHFEDSIKAASLLKSKYKDVFFTALFSESQQNMQVHQVYYDELVSLVEQLGIRENVAIIRGFQSDQSMDSFLRTNKAAVFPYGLEPGHEMFGASGAARQAMTSNIPVITSCIPHFSDVASIKADSPDAIARELDRLFSDGVAVKSQLARQEQFLLDNSWEKVARMHVDVFERK